MATSDLYDLKPSYPFRPVKVIGKSWDRATQSETLVYTEPPEGYYIQASPRSGSTGVELAALERREVVLDCRLVKTPEGTPLKLPEWVTAEHVFTLELRGRTGTASIMARPDSQITEVADELGPTFQAVWSYHD